MSDQHEKDLPVEDVGGDEVDRGMPSITKKKRQPGSGGVMQKIVVAVIGIVVVLALVAVNGGFSGGKKDEDKPKTGKGSNSEVVNRLGPAPSLPAPPPPPRAPEENKPATATVVRTGDVAPPPPSSAMERQRGNGKQEPTPQERKRNPSLLAFGNMSKPPKGANDGQGGAAYQATAAGGDGSLAESDTADGLGARLKGTTVQGTRAGLLRDRSFFITQGTFLDCALETALSSDVPGMTACRLTRDIYSTDSKVLLLERGSKVVGQYQGGLKRGQARIFVLWTRVETPNGVIVNIDSPGTDALGRSGLDGFVDTHFWERFGGAVMLSLIDDVGTFVANKASGDGNNNQVQFGSTADAATQAAGIALENSINIPPTLLKNQGDHINIFVARDLDFRGVYDLKPAN
ncbi:type IV secretion system protein VirB10 [Citrobacter sp. RHBSTW-00821]|uniref:type IV secretion system protein VirB10 n=1 Tax=Citrobacter sp. RHBSTW-00821 TaxID=2742663 RepID=UPI0015E9A1A2|nr:type IV secretion system protein VirB10 [Citrobacter sp. RHBSTW-00821]QLT57114.1 type IV secretion system protein VirB10 [Citrobacter sp. RHBSTW-00821]